MEIYKANPTTMLHAVIILLFVFVKCIDAHDRHIYVYNIILYKVYNIM